MPKSSPYTHWMQRVDVANDEPIDIEEAFPNIRYMKAEGLNDIGKSKNIYTEEYADSDQKRLYLPDGDTDNYTNESTTITMSFLAIGDAATRQQTLQSFFDYIRVGVHRYWDDARNRVFDFIVTGEIKIGDEKWHGDDPYVEVAIPLQNIYGKTFPNSGDTPLPDVYINVHNPIPQGADT